MANATRPRLEAELLILDTFDDVRSSLGHDYGGGQRVAELERRRRALIYLEAANPHPTRGDVELDELVAAWARVAAPRIRRLERETYRLERSRSSRKSRQAWRRTATALGLVGSIADYIVDAQADAKVGPR